MEKIITKPTISEHFQKREPSAIRLAQIAFARRKDPVRAINLAIGNVRLPVHPAMKERLQNLSSGGSPFRDGVVPYTASIGEEEARRAFLKIIAACGCETEGLHAQITDGGSQAMELAILGICGPAASEEQPLLLIEPFYTNYYLLARRLGRSTVSITRRLEEDGHFSLPDLASIEKVIRREKPGGLLVIPYDNPTGQLMRHETLTALAKLCVEHNLWLISDEAYRSLYYIPQDGVVSVWGLSEREVPGIQGRRISIETASKVWNACGLRIGALITDNQEFHQKSVAEYTANLCANAIGQYIFGALAGESVEDLQAWYRKLADYYRKLIPPFTEAMKEALPGIIVSNPDASIYSVIDVRKLVDPGFDAVDFVLYCASGGKVMLEGEPCTLLVAPMSGFYAPEPGSENPGRTQMRIAYVEGAEVMSWVPRLFTELFRAYLKESSSKTG